MDVKTVTRFVWVSVVVLILTTAFVPAGVRAETARTISLSDDLIELEDPIRLTGGLFATDANGEEYDLRDLRIRDLAGALNFRPGSLGTVPLFIHFLDPHDVSLMNDDPEGEIRRAVDDMMERVGALNSLEGRFESLFECEEMVSLKDDINDVWYWQNGAFLDEDSIPRMRLSLTRMDHARKNRITVFSDFTDFGVYALIGIMFGTLL
jgi:hypothetical protein